LDSLRLRAGGGQDLKAVSDYRAGIQVCSQMLTAAEAAWNPATQPAPVLFLKRVREQVTQAYSHFHQASLQPERRGNSFLIPVLINGRTEARFILDTGAEITTITKALAERAGIPATGRLAPVGMADGTRLDAPVVRLDSLRFGHFDTPGVEAVMLPNPPDEGVDGLLGMNVLGSFLIRFDPARGLFELEQFNSK
jgi:clan AA aspartic protease (TIGR02281 family)